MAGIMIHRLIKQYKHPKESKWVQGNSKKEVVSSWKL